MRNQSKIDDITGKKYNMLTVVGIAEHDPIKWLCKCDCGNYTKVSTGNVKQGRVKSCGCLSHVGNPKHNLNGTRIYRIYKHMINRCYRPNVPAYPDYGGRGITVCKAWRENILNFYKWAMKNGYQDNLSLDRKNNNRGYTPQNCRWTTSKEQSNNKRSNLEVTYNGKTQTLSEWCEELSLNYSKIYTRIVRGWDVADALEYDYDARIIKRGKEYYENA